MKCKNVEISVELVKTWQCLGFDLRPKDFESHALSTQPRTQNYTQTLVTNKAESRCYEISNATDRDDSKKATK